MTTRDIPAAGETVCFRHADRPASVRCQRCSRTICLDCMVPAPVGFQCPECVSAAAKQSRQLILAGTGKPLLTYALIAINVAVAMASLAYSSEWAQGEPGTVGVRGGLIGGGFAFIGGHPELIGVAHGEWYRIVTGAFIHGGPVHLGFNMLVLWQAGALLEGALGRGRFAVLFTVSLLGGSFGALLVAPDVLTVGASGGVFGLMGALFVAQRKGLVGSRGSSVGVLIAINLVLTVAIPGISIGGHIGGLVAGTAVGWMMFEFDRRRLSPVMPVTIAGVLCAVLIVGCRWAADLWLSPIF